MKLFRKSVHREGGAAYSKRLQVEPWLHFIATALLLTWGLQVISQCSVPQLSHL